MTTLIAAACMLTPQIKEAVQSHPGFLLVAFVLSFALLIGLYVKRRESPINLILLAAFVSYLFEIEVTTKIMICFIYINARPSIRINIHKTTSNPLKALSYSIKYIQISSIR